MGQEEHFERKKIGKVSISLGKVSDFQRKNFSICSQDSIQRCRRPFRENILFFLQNSQLTQPEETNHRRKSEQIKVMIFLSQYIITKILKLIYDKLNYVKQNSIAENEYLFYCSVATFKLHGKHLAWFLLFTLSQLPSKYMPKKSVLRPKYPKPKESMSQNTQG